MRIGDINVIAAPGLGGTARDAMRLAVHQAAQARDVIANLGVDVIFGQRAALKRAGVAPLDDGAAAVVRRENGTLTGPVSMIVVAEATGQDLARTLTHEAAHLMADHAPAEAREAVFGQMREEGRRLLAALDRFYSKAKSLAAPPGQDHFADAVIALKEVMEPGENEIWVMVSDPRDEEVLRDRWASKLVEAALKMPACADMAASAGFDAAQFPDYWRVAMGMHRARDASTVLDKAAATGTLTAEDLRLAEIGLRNLHEEALAHWVEGVDLALALGQPFEELRLDLSDQVMQAGLENALAARAMALDDLEQVAAVVGELLQEDGTCDALANAAAQANALHRAEQPVRAEAAERRLEHIAREMSVGLGERLLVRLANEHGADEAWHMVSGAGGQLERWNACGLAAMPLAADERSCLADILASAPTLGHVLADAKVAHDRQTGRWLRTSFAEDLGTAVLANLSMLARLQPGSPQIELDTDFASAARRTAKRHAAVHDQAVALWKAVDTLCPDARASSQHPSEAAASTGFAR